MSEEIDTTTTASTTDVSATEQTASAVTGENETIVPAERSVFSDNANNETTSWTDSLPEELKANPHLKTFKSANDVIKSYVGLCSMAGKKGLMPPPPGADSNDVQAYLAARRGSVDSPEAYSVKYEQIKQFGISEEAYKQFSQNLFNAGLSDREHTQVVRTFAQFREYERQAWIKENNANCEQALLDAKHAWGVDYESKLTGVKELMKQFPEAKKAFEALGVQNNFHVLDMLATFAGTTREGGAPRLQGQAVDAGSIEAQLNKLVASPAYNDPTSPAHAAAMEQFWKLMAQKASARS